MRPAADFRRRPRVPADADEPFEFDDALSEDLGVDVEFVFGQTLTAEGWREFVGLAHRISSRWGRTKVYYTLNQIAEFLAARLVAPSFGPVEIAGVRCEKAGAFLGVRRLVGEETRFSPSTPIRGRLKRRDLDRLWARLRWITLGRLPPLKTTWVDRATFLTFLSLSGLVGGGIAAIWFGAVAFLLHGISACKISWTLFRLAERFENPLPAEIVTFGDLARRLVEAQNPAAAAR